MARWVSVRLDNKVLFGVEVGGRFSQGKQAFLRASMFNIYLRGSTENRGVQWVC